MYKIQTPDSLLESLFIGFTICLTGLALCFFGSSILKGAFILMCILTIQLLIFDVFLHLPIIEGQKYAQLMAVVTSLLSIPIGFKCGTMTNHYSVPFFSAITCFTISQILLDMLQVTDELYIKSVVEFIAATFGFYIGQKLQDHIKVFVTSLLGAILTVIGFSIGIQIWPI